MSSDPIDQKNFFLLNERRPVWKTALRISTQYLSFGMLWILLSDSLVSFFIKDQLLIAKLSIVKGLFYVILSALFIYSLIRKVLFKLSDNEQVILENRNELKTMLYYDYLTGLSNRRKMIERMPDFLKDSKETGKALMYIDIDNIKLINDTMGHTFGDALIKGTAQRIASILPPSDELYRLGGDEFIILSKFSNISEIEGKAQKIINLFDSPLSVEKMDLHTTISMGISLYPLHCEDPGELLKCADIAMYQSKKNGKKQAVVYNPGMMSAINERMRIEEHLHEALANHELEVYYQPQFDAQTRKITGYEALIRWKNPILGNVPPDTFISVAEETHLIIPIGEWVLREACKFIKVINLMGYPDLTMSVNISMIQLLQENFVSVVEKVMEETQIDPSKLELEITESILMESYIMIKGYLEQLRLRGISIALDDFGKGYSSLSYLEQLPIDVLKIDKIFVDGIQSGDEDSSITGNIVRIGKKLGLLVIAEGVENETQLNYLKAQQCDRIQGWIFSKALTANDAAELTSKNLG
jgi:diguanylate cyclase (GGDEF)-like protein